MPEKSENLKNTICENLNDLMLRSGTKNIELAEAVGVTKAAVTNWRKGTNSIDLEMLMRVCEYLRVPLERMVAPSTINYAAIDLGGYGGRYSDFIEEFQEARKDRPKEADGERDLVSFYRSMDAQGRERLLEQAAFLAERHPLNQADSMGA